MKQNRLIQLIDSSAIPPGRTLSIPLHRHQSSAELIWMERGAVEVMMPHAQLTLSAGELLLLPSGLWHHLEFPMGNEQRIHKLVFTQPTNEGETQFQRATVNRPDFVGSLFAEIERELHGTASGAEQKQRLLLELLLMELDHIPLAGPGPGASNAYGLARIVYELEETCHLPFSLTETAERAGISKFHFSRQFKELCGETPLQFVISCRMDRAQQLLLATELAVASIAAHCGYKSATQFHAAFTRHSGITPKHYRNFQREQVADS
ncbi:AraC family transcriptional regulator [Planococcus sp. ISL-109]|uniref:AraC family transcriptional regulator n=1 Tax=Planococcus sp. ISL-109 TaxID=2819166 RepID=UPI001BEA1B16|nr:AraC family transcriptional regulator [Planococcus sp. ISL-109]MBT2582190.1 AraC family transcriptional regulator [Planococcus sp. ISL-109]